MKMGKLAESQVLDRRGIPDSLLSQLSRLNVMIGFVRRIRRNFSIHNLNPNKPPAKHEHSITFTFGLLSGFLKLHRVQVHCMGFGSREHMSVFLSSAFEFISSWGLFTLDSGLRTVSFMILLCLLLGL